MALLFFITTAIVILFFIFRECPLGTSLRTWCSSHPDGKCLQRCLGDNEVSYKDKPIIYLYPEQEQEVTVQLDYHGTLIADYPDYDHALGGWKVTANPNGDIINHADGKEYSYLFWEGKPETPIQWDMSSGFVVSGEDTKKFLQKTLSEMGLTPKEYNEFIVYWYPRMMNNTYNLISFAGSQYTDMAPLTITPKPDSLLRVFMIFTPLEDFIKIPSQKITPFSRKGFTVIEWGGTEM